MIAVTDSDRKNRRVMVIGASGFVGGHLLKCLVDQGYTDLVATKLPHESIAPVPGAESRIKIVDLNILHAEDTAAMLGEFRPELLIHLAAQSSVGLSFSKPELTMQINILGSLHILDGIRAAGCQTRLLFIGSSEQYGIIAPSDLPVSEAKIPVPVSPYAVSKLAVEQLALVYAKSYEMDVILVRAFNHIGPGQLPIFVVSDFARQIVAVEKGLVEPVMRVGDLSARRDFTDVRDIVRGYVALIEQGCSSEVYNIGSGVSYEVRDVLSRLLAASSVSIDVQMDPARIRPVEVPDIRADISKIRNDTGWSPILSLDQSLVDVLEYWRQNDGFV